MRLTTAATIGILALSGAAIAQVASTPAEQKTVPTNEMTDSDRPIADNSTATPDPSIANQTVDDATENRVAVPETPGPRPR